MATRGMLAILLAAQCGASVYDAPMPMFMWSGLNYFTDRNVYVNEAVCAGSLGPLVRKITMQDTSDLAGFEEQLTASNEIGSPNVIVLALYDKLSTEDVTGLSRTGSLHSLQYALDSSASSLVLPYTYLNGTDSNPIESSLHNAFGDVHDASSEQIMSAEWLEKANNEEGTTVVKVAMDAAQPALLSKATALLDRICGGKYLVVLTSKQPVEQSVVYHRQAGGRHLLQTDKAPQSYAGWCGSEDLHFDPLTNNCFRYVYMTPSGGLKEREVYKDVELNKKLKDWINKQCEGCKFVDIGPKGSGGAVFGSEEEASEAMATLNGKKFQGRVLETDTYVKGWKADD